jgi:hypothetical protein
VRTPARPDDALLAWLAEREKDHEQEHIDNWHTVTWGSKKKR